MLKGKRPVVTPGASTRQRRQQNQPMSKEIIAEHCNGINPESGPKPGPEPELLDPDDPDAEGLELHAETCPCRRCKAFSTGHWGGSVEDRDDPGPDAEGLELHAETCPCRRCKAFNNRLELLTKGAPESLGQVDNWLDRVCKYRADAVAVDEARELIDRLTWRTDNGEPWAAWAVEPKDRDAAFKEYNAAQERAEEAALADALDLDSLHHTLPLVGGDTTPVPALLTRSDGQTLLYSGRLNSIFGEPSGGKTWVAIMAVIEAVRSGARVVFWDFDDRPSTLAARLTALGADDLIQGGQLLYATPGMVGDDGEMEAMCDWMGRGRRPGLVVIDSVEAAGLATDSNNAAPWFDAHTSPFLARDIGVLPLDHVPKRREDRPKGAIGSQHKRARISGAGLLLIGTPWTKKQGGTIKLVNHKDRLGDLPAPDNKVVAIITVTHGENGRLNYSIDAPSAEENTEDVTGLLLAAIAAQGPDGVRTKKNIRGLLTVGHKKLDPALDDLLNNGWVRIEYDGKANIYRVTPEGEQMLNVDLE